MSLAAEIKKGMFAAMKAKNSVEKEILRVALGEITRTGDESTDVEVQAILKKIVKSNREAMGVESDAAKKAQLEEEVSILQRYLPQVLSVAEIIETLSSVADAIKAAPNQGPAMGIAMKTLKQAAAEAESADVAQAVSKLRA